MENTENTNTTQPELSITDLKNVKTLLDVSIRRGVFQPNELSSVGAVYDKLNNFLEAVSEQSSTETATEATA